MDRLTGGATFAAIVLSLTLAGCGGGSSAPAAETAAPVTPPAVGGDTPVVVIEGVSTPTSVSVVTAKNAQ